MCIFCKIINNQLPSYKIYEDENILAILDIAQTTYGHTLVMPKKHIESFSTVDNDTLADLSIKTKKVVERLYDKLKFKGYHILSNTNEVSGQSVDHLHFHIIPRYDSKDSVNISFEKNNINIKEVYEKISM